MEIINFENIKTQSSEKNKVQDYITLTHHYLRALDDMTPEHETYADVVRDFKNRIKMLNAVELEEYFSILFKKYPQDLKKVVNFFLGG